MTIFFRVGYNFAMRKFRFATLLFFWDVFLCGSAFSAPLCREKIPEPSSFTVHFSTEDFGSCLEKIVVALQDEVAQERVSASDFLVTKKTRKSGKRVYLEKVYSTLVPDRAYVSDGNGFFAGGRGRFVTLEFDVRPENFSKLDVLTAGLPKKMANVDDFFYYSVKNDALGLSVDKCSAFVNSAAARFSFDVFDGSVAVYDDDGEFEDYDEVPMGYAYYEPESAALNPDAGEKIPLVVWFHGLGEGGKNRYAPILNAKVTNLVSDEIQSKFPSGFYLLVPQCPTAWLMVGERTVGGVHYWAPVDKDGVKEKISSGISTAKNAVKGTVRLPFRFVRNRFRSALGKEPLPYYGDDEEEDEDEDDDEEEYEEYEEDDEDDEDDKEDAVVDKYHEYRLGIENLPFASVSYFTFVVKDLIDSFVAGHPDVDPSRIFVGGCSAGGYMTMNMVLQFRGFFRAAFPTCEFYLDSKITDEQIEFLSGYPIFFTYAENDTTVNPKKSSEATIARIRELGSDKLRSSVYPDVHDKSGRFFGNDGGAHQYDGHESWIYVLNNDNGVFDWLSSFPPSSGVLEKDRQAE